MQRVPSAVDIDGHAVHTGAKVQVMWLGVWYEGIVIKIGPKGNLCRVCDVASKETVLLERKHLKLMETNAMDKCLSAGTYVMYKDGEHWKEGVVDSNSAVGAMRISWRKTGLSEENLTWFELSHIAPVINNEVYEEHNRDLLEAGKSGLLQNNAIEPRPRTMDNMLYQSESDGEEDELVMKRTSPNSSGKEHPTTNAVVDAIVEDKKGSDIMPLPPPPSAFPFHPVFMPIPPMMPSAVHPYPYMYLPLDQNNYAKMAPSFMSVQSFQSTLPHPRTLKKPRLSHSSVPCIVSCTKSTNGIPPHPSSKFFQNVRNVKFGKQNLSSNLSRANAKLTKPPAAECMQHAAAPDAPSKHPTKVLKNKKHPKKMSPTAVQPKMSPAQTFQNSHPHTKHPSQPPSFTTSPSHLCPPKIHSAAKNTTSDQHVSQSRNPRHPPHKSPRSTDTKQLQTTTTHHSTPIGDNHHQPAVFSQMRRHTDQQRKEVLENDGERNTDRKIPSQRQSPDKGSMLELVSVSDANVIVSHGGSTLLTCVAMSPYAIQYHWFKDSEPLSEHNPFFTQPAPGMLQIQMASLSLAGEYKCVVSSNQDSFERVFHLQVCPDTRASGDTEVSQLKITNRVNLTSQELSTEAPPSVPSPEARVSSEHQQKSSPQKELPIIVVSEPQPQPISPSPIQTPAPSSDKDTSGIRYEKEAKVEVDETPTKRQRVGEERRLAKRNRRRVSNPLKNDIELYLDGYGENYGALSANANLELGPWLDDLSEEGRMGHDTSKRKKRKRRKKTKKSSSHGSSSPPKSAGSLKRPKKSTKTSKPPSAMLGNKKIQVEAEDLPPKPLEGWQVAQKKVKTNFNPRKATVPTAEVEEEEMNSVAVHTSVGVSSGSEVSLGKGEGGQGGRLKLPQEQESLNDSVRRLQLSVEEFCPEQMQFAEKEKKKGFLSSIFSAKNKSS